MRNLRSSPPDLMPVTYTNRLGQSFILCRRANKQGRLQYCFVLQPSPEDERIAKLPAGYTIHESVHGRVTLRSGRARRPIEPAELEYLREFLRRRPRLSCCRVEDRANAILVFEPGGISYDERLRRQLSSHPEGTWAIDLRRATYDAVIRFRLVDATHRVFAADRMRFSGHLQGWWKLDQRGSILDLAEALLPHLMHTSFYELGS